MFKKSSNYFLSFNFEWNDIFKILGISEKDGIEFTISEKYFYQSPNANDPNGLGIDSSSALFEYYIIPNSLVGSSSIFDQQLKRFFETPNINYGPVLENKKNKTSSITCFFNKRIIENKAGFSICFLNDCAWKTIIFTFDTTYLNLKDVNKQWGQTIPFETFEITNGGSGDNIVKKVSVDSDIFLIQILIQSQNDAQSSPFSQDLYKMFKNNK